LIFVESPIEIIIEQPFSAVQEHQSFAEEMQDASEGFILKEHAE
jgi:hypothetical protein